ncbi:SAM-dependent methyltransferase [Alicyclobacillus sp. ALC3]|uniref:SAM-dependent methyltransferase n=1 Tax=Alicyclobacillus sp. ALC3 TaxID=2796143 RepID=UPI0023791052|nr:SAM-dependent methyltransferase [Alicyclobacillus sp. ALC3]WDL97175.1 SAM-dependent methyltransferase [Alicyclobacillus sp. ALC3]
MNSEAQEIVIKPIGTVHSPRVEAIDDNWGSVVSKIQLDPTQFDEQSLWGLLDFSHCEVIYFMHGVSPEQIEKTARHPRNNVNFPKVGIFAQRAKSRPNRIGVSRCRVISVKGLEVTVQSLDAIDGSPVLDIKPYMEEFAPIGDVYQPKWSREIMSQYYQK